jgi:CubicO group peptidase (beta-lactamase class C family)
MTKTSLDEGMQELHAWLSALHGRGRFSGSVVVARDGQICFESHLGVQETGGVALSRHSSYSLASVSKQFTGMGIMQLAEQGRLQLNDPLAKFIPELANFGSVTIRQMLHHTSGLPDYLELAVSHWDSRILLKFDDLIKMFQIYCPPPRFTPGEAFEYSNTGYALLGEIIARASGTSYADFLSKEVFEPLGMKDSAAFNLASQECVLSKRVFAFRRSCISPGKKKLYDLNYLDGLFGDAGIYSSAADLVIWDRALREGTLLPCERYQEAYVSGRLNSGQTTGYGFGWDIPSHDVVAHKGEWRGFAAYIRRDLKRHMLLVLLSNLAPSILAERVYSRVSCLVEKGAFAKAV